MPRAWHNFMSLSLLLTCWQVYLSSGILLGMYSMEVVVTAHQAWIKSKGTAELKGHPSFLLYAHKIWRDSKAPRADSEDPWEVPRGAYRNNFVGIGCRATIDMQRLKHTLPVLVQCMYTELVTKVKIAIQTVWLKPHPFICAISSMGWPSFHLHHLIMFENFPRN